MAMEMKIIKLLYPIDPAVGNLKLIYKIFSIRKSGNYLNIIKVSLTKSKGLARIF